MGTIAFTPAQQSAVQTVDRAVLVSAAAGSGKTAVLAERCAYLIAGAPEPFRCNVDELLVVTFTEAAAAEMKERIGAALRVRVAEAPQDQRLRMQLALLDTAQISTLHAFCLWMVRRWFDRAEIDATAQILDEDEARLLRIDALRGLFDELYGGSSPLAERFRRLVEDYGLGHDGSIADFVLRLAAFVVSLDDPDGWLMRAEDGSDQRLAEIRTEWARALRDELARQAEQNQQSAELIAARYPVGAFYGNLLRQLADAQTEWLERLESGATWDDVRQGIAAHELSSKGAPRLGRDADEAELAQRDAARDLWNESRTAWFEKRLRDPYTRFSADEIAAAFKRTAPYVATLVELTRAFIERYGVMKRGLGVIDFSDLERRAFDLLTQPGDADGETSIGMLLRRRFAHVLVDEYQDINPLQARILAEVSRDGADGRAGNLFTVGDVKQSIYRFRLAEPELFVQRAADLRGRETGACIDLQHNFRSHRSILDATNAVFRGLMRTELGGIAYDAQAELRPPPTAGSDPVPPRGEPVELHVLDPEVDGDAPQDGGEDDARWVDTADPAQWSRVQREAYLAGRRVRALMDSGATVMDEGRSRPLRYGDVCVLLRSVRHSAGSFAEMLTRLGIPVWAEAGTSLFDAREVRDVLALLEVLDNPRQDIPLAAVLRSGVVGMRFDENELADLRLMDTRAAFHESVLDYPQRGTNADLRTKVAGLLRRIERYRRELRERPLADVLWRVIVETGYQAYVGGLSGGSRRRANLVALHERARQFGGFRRQGLRRFLGFMQSLRDAGDALAAPAGPGEGDDVVRIMSVHKSKGLEFPIVILADLGRRFNLGDSRGRFLYDRRVGVGIKAVEPDRLIEYPTALHQWCARASADAALAEELRVLYVAMTRARERLVLIGTESPETRERCASAAAERDERVGVLRVLGAQNPLQWLLAAQAGMPTGAVETEESVAREPLFVNRVHPAEEIGTWTLPSARPDAHAALRQAVTQLEPLPAGEPVPAELTTAQSVVDRLEFDYPQLALTSIPVAYSASGGARVSGLEPGGLGEAEEPAVDLIVPGEDEAGDRDRAKRRGQVVHRALQFLRWDGLPDAAAPVDAEWTNRVGERLAQLVAGGIITQEDATEIEVADLAWFLATDLGGRVRQAGPRYHREWMFLARESPAQFDPTVIAGDDDQVLVRGVVDGVLDEAERMAIVDYKTDRITAAQAGVRAERYAGQLCLYARAVAAVFGRPVTEAHLVFLHGRTIVTKTEDAAWLLP
jgi:ATP-dependent helicase/nuclease subunit A